MKKYVWLIAGIISLCLWSCYYDNEEALYPTLSSSCDTTNVTYNGTVAPIISNNCTSCHSGGAPSGSVNLSGYTNVKSYASGGTLMNALNGNGVAQMPPSGALSACNINQIGIWINNGMLNN